MSSQERDRLVEQLHLLTVLAAVPQKMPELLKIYQAGSVDDDNFEETTSKIANLLNCDLTTAAQVHDLQLRRLHPNNQVRLARQIEAIRTRLEEL